MLCGSNSMHLLCITVIIIFLHKVHATSDTCYIDKSIVNKGILDDIISDSTNNDDKGEFELLAISVHFSVIRA